VDAEDRDGNHADQADDTDTDDDKRSEDLDERHAPLISPS
jgi:hypothetical protein